MREKIIEMLEELKKYVGETIRPDEFKKCMGDVDFEYMTECQSRLFHIYKMRIFSERDEESEVGYVDYVYYSEDEDIEVIEVGIYDDLEVEE